MLLSPTMKLPPKTKIEVRVQITINETLISEGYLSIDNDGEKDIPFKSAGIAVQAGVYEILRGIWPERIDSPQQSV